jgi:hypothetical protein
MPDEELLAAAEQWHAKWPPSTAPHAARVAFLDQYRAWCAENHTNPLELLRMARAEAGKGPHPDQWNGNGR